MIDSVRTFARIVAAVGLAAGIAWTGPVSAQGSSGTRPSGRRSDEGPVVNLPSSPGMAEGGTFQMGSDTAGFAGGGGGKGGPLGGAFGGAVRDPKKEAENRIKKLIQRLG